MIARYSIIIFFCFALFGKLNLSGQTHDTIHLEEVSVYSLYTATQADLTGKSVSIIRGKEIREMPVNSIDELLGSIMSVETRSRGPFGVQSDFSIRGSSFNQVLVIIDGMRINDPLTGHFNSNIPVTISEIERIEIIRGPASAIYGPDAVGGIIHIITKNYSQHLAKNSLSGQISGIYGHYNLFQTNSGFFLSKGKISLGTGLSMNISDGHPLDTDTLHGDFDLKTWSASFAVRPTTKINFSMRTSADMRTYNARYFYTISPFDESREQVNRWWNQFRIQYQPDEKYRTELLAGYQVTRDSFLFNPLYEANNHKTATEMVQWNHYFDPWNSLKFAAGIQYYNRRIRSNDRGNHHDWHAGLFATGSLINKNGFSMQASIRSDLDELYGYALLPQVNFSYRTGKSVVRGGAGKSIRAPDYTERYVSTNLAGQLLPGRNIGNPDLQSEKSWGIELGLDHHLTSSVVYHSTFFRRYSNHLIDFVLTNSNEITGTGNLQPDEMYFYARNISRLKTFGFESDLESSHQAGRSLNIDLALSYVFLYSAGDSVIVSKYIANHSHHMLKGSAIFRNKRFLLSVHTILKVRDEDIAENIQISIEPYYMLWHAKLELNLRRSALFATFQVQNIFNQDYSDILGARMPGRWIMGGLTWRFERRC